MSPELSAVSDHEYVLLTTYRRTGEAVSTPVWIVRDGEELLVTTGASSGKVARLRHTSTIALQPCDMRGTVKAESQPVTAHARIDDSAATRRRLDAALLGKYGLKYRAILAGAKLSRTVSVALVVTD